MFALSLRMKIAAVLVLVLAACTQSARPVPQSMPRGPQVVLIIRHGEKPEAGDGVKDPNLTKRGYERAEALAKVIPERFARPDFLIATKATAGSNRPVETITPLSKALHEEIDSSLKTAEIDALAHEVLTDSKYGGKTVLIAWHHENIPELARALGAKDAPGEWDAKVFDRVWEITFDGGTVTFKDLPQRALAGDSEK